MKSVLPAQLTQASENGVVEDLTKEMAIAEPNPPGFFK